MLARTPVAFDAVVVTAPNERSARAYAQELAARIPARYCCRDGGGESELLLLAAADPAGARVGSGGGTLNALDELRAALRARGKALGDVAVLMVHSGGDSQRSPTNSVCGKAWSALNSLHHDAADSATATTAATSINTPLDLLLEQLLPLFEGIPRGCLAVASSDVLLILPTGQPPDWAGVRGVVGLATHVSAELGPNHGAYVVEEVEEEGADTSTSALRPVRRYLQKAPLAQLRAEGAVSTRGRGGEEVVTIDTGVLYFAPEAARALASLLDESPFNRCTARGITAAAPPLRLELYSDMLCALSGGMGHGFGEYLRMDGTPAAVATDLKVARERLWGLMNPLPFAALAPEGALFAHLGTTAELMEVRPEGGKEEK
jgi:fucokinase